MTIEKLDYTVNYNGHTVTCFEVGSVPTIGYASLEDAMTDTNPVSIPEVVFDAACALLDQGIRLTTIYVHMDEDGYAYMNWDEIPEELTAEDIALIEGEESVRKSGKLSRKVRRAIRIDRNKSRKGSDRAHGKRRKDSAKNLRRWENDEAQMERAQVMWHENNKGEYIPRPLDRKYHEKRYLRTTDTSRIPVYYVDTANHLDMEYKERKRTVKRGCVVYDYVPAIVTPEAVQGEPV